MKDLSLDPEFFALLSGSYLRLLGIPLIPHAQGLHDPARWLYEQAPCSVLAHNTDPDPRFIYANRAAQACFEYTWEELTSLPSRLSAEAPNREERQRLLKEVSSRGFATGYAGLRISKTGRRFWIEDGTVWQLLAEDGEVRGQAAIFSRWRDA
ncbi:MAG TPA: MEKHLA domain-containing protein [Acetobacteraceae bacterium]|nr:MEKHLA domain-containing protein [Acetobacteraceae bacterium]